ncbi:MAG TPA: molybdopterin cofactor-binding domain-containing protein [Phenylobacterium sp.]|jgi:CO/xanthine dehydrogenase Mo-binding subunit|nr:molybdopterin cofactor-binding domain-containing protein [Phenylobacterium sp.]
MTFQARTPDPAAPSRRGFLIAATSAGVALGFAGEAVAATGAPAGFEPTVWYDIGRDGVVTVNVIRAELGQHVGTAIARIVADELEADWSKVRIKTVDSDPKWGLMVTGGSWSVWQSYPIYSQAGAAGRMALIEEGAKLLKVAPGACTARNGAVHAGKASITYGQIVARGDLSRKLTPEELAKLPIKAAADRRLIGKATQARDIPGKTNGQGVYGLDSHVPGMIFARPKIPPTRYDSVVTAIDDSAAKSVPGYQRSIALTDPSGTVPGWVVVLADSFIAANKAAELVKVTWKSGPAAQVSEADLQRRSMELIADPKVGALVVEDPGVDQAFAAAKSKVEATYTTSTALHFQMEPVNALAFEKDGVFEVHTGNQWQSLVLPWLAKALDRPETTIVMRSYLLGGGFGRRLNGDYAVGAALAAKAAGKPVKLVLTRADDSRFDSPRSPSVQTVRMAFGEGGRVTAMEHTAAAGWPTLAMAPFFMPKGTNGVAYDPFSISGADHWYTVGAQRVRAVNNDLANTTFRPGWLRSVGPGWTNWALESFMDEAAHSAGVDPLAFRLKLLDAAGRNAGSGPTAVGGAKRQAAVLARVAAKAGWGKPLPKNTGLGLATSFGQERDMPTWVACAARVRVDPTTGVVKVEKLDLVADCGTVVHPDGALAQMQGASLWGMSLALFEGTTFKDGQVRDTNLGAYTPLRMADVPELDVEFMPSTEPPVGLGEPATTVVGPAIGNAIFNAVGARVRDLPIRPAAVLKAMKA